MEDQVKTLMDDKLISDGEMHAIALAVVAAHGKDGCSKDEIMSVIDWAEKVRIDQGLLENVLRGNVFVCHIDGEIQFQISPRGKHEAEQLEKQA